MGTGGRAAAVLLRARHATALEIPGFAGWVTGAELTAPSVFGGRPLRLLSVHCPAGERGYVRTLHEILDRLARLRAGADLILGGDFNVVVGNRQPRERLTMTRGERELLERLAADFDLVSCWQAANPGRPLAQTLRWSADRLAAYHCDGIFVPSSWASRLASCRVVIGPRWIGLSDHNPVMAEFTARITGSRRPTAPRPAAVGAPGTRRPTGS